MKTKAKVKATCPTCDQVYHLTASGRVCHCGLKPVDKQGRKRLITDGATWSYSILDGDHFQSLPCDKITCPDCDGAGVIDGECDECGGSGEVECCECGNDKECDECDGDGTCEQDCCRCNGTGKI